MIINKVVKVIEDLKHNTDSRLREVQGCKVPAIYDMHAEIDQTYTIDGQEYVYNAGKLILLIKNLPIYYNLDRSIFTDTMSNMVNNKELHPFLIFLDGRFIKWSNIKLVHDFKDRYVIIENFDLESHYTSLDKTVNMPYMLNSWDRFSHNVYGNFPAKPSEMDQWQYVLATNTVECVIDSTSYIGFVSKLKYSNYTHQVTLSSTDSDDDVISTIIAYHRDEYGKEHTLSVVRSPGGVLVKGTLAEYMIVYNLNQSNVKVIYDGNNKIATAIAGGWAVNSCTVKVERTETSVTVTTSQFNSSTLDISTKTTIDLMSTPELKLFLGPKQYGYGCMSQTRATFKNVSFIDLRDNIILPKASMIVLPFNVKYLENQIGTTPDNIFAFDSNGLASSIAPLTTIDLDDPYIYYDTQYLVPNKIQSCNVNVNYKISKSNIILFKNGELYDNANITLHGLNTFLVNNGTYSSNSIKYKLFYYIYGNQSKDNILHVANTNTAINEITATITPPSYLETLSTPFDFKFEKYKQYSENVADALEYITQYNPWLFNDVYKDLNKIDVINYTGSYILGIASSGYVTMSRGNRDGISIPMIFINGELYKYYHYTTYKGSNFTFPTISILETDNIEIMMFRDIDNRILEGQISSQNDSDIYYLDSDIDIRNLRIFSKDAYNRAYDLPNTEYIRYNVDFIASRVDSSKINITLKDSYYYDRKLYFASARQFRHYYTVIKNTVNSIKLPEVYSYCRNKNNYMVFVNGRKLDSNDFQITKIDIGNPFEDVSIYLSSPIQIGYNIDIFYVPEELKEVVTSSSIPSNGDIIIDKAKLPYAFNSELYFVFVNGKKIRTVDILNIDSNKAKILNNINTTSNIAILSHIDSSAIIEELFVDNVYDSTITSLSNIELNALYSNGNSISNTETNIKDGRLDNDAITKKVIRDYWLRTITTKVNSDALPDILSYNYDEILPYLEKDSSNNTIID